MTKTGLVILVMLATMLLPIDRRSIAQGPAEGREVTRRVARPVTPRPKSARNDDADSESPKPPGNDRAPTTDDIEELREELQRLKAEMRSLKSSERETATKRRSAPRGSSGSVFEAAAASGVDEDDGEPRPLGRFGFQLDDEQPAVANPFGDIQLIQQGDWRPSEFGAAPGQHLRPRRTNELGSIGLPAMPEYIPNMPARTRKVEAEFGDGLTVKTDDDYFSLTFHNLTQVDGRFFSPAGDPLHDNFIVPRQRWYVIGNISPMVRYYTVINRGYGTLDVLDAWVDMSVGSIDRDELQIRVGRMKTPYTYEYIKISETDLIAPERSVFVGNLAPNREIGIMAHGQLLDKRFEYALGLFNGPRRSFEDFNSGKDLFTFINTKPFLDGDFDFLKQLNIGGSWNWGNEHNPAQPFALRTANDQSTSSAAGNVSPTFFRFGDKVFEDGTRMQWSGDLAYYYKSFGMLAGYQGGFQDYALTVGVLPTVQQLRLGQQEFVGVIGGNKTRVPMTGYSVAAFYFLTGEEVTRRVNLLEPRKPYAGSTWREGNIGGIELFTRYAFMDLGGNVFTGGLADSAISSNSAAVFDNGVNWYLNHYVKLTFDWQYSAYGNPVLLTPAGRNTSFNNLFWLRTQVFF